MKKLLVLLMIVAVGSTAHADFFNKLGNTLKYGGAECTDEYRVELRQELSTGAVFFNGSKNPERWYSASKPVMEATCEANRFEVPANQIMEPWVRTTSVCGFKVYSCDLSHDDNGDGGDQSTATSNGDREGNSGGNGNSGSDDSGSDDGGASSGGGTGGGDTGTNEGDPDNF